MVLHSNYDYHRYVGPIQLFSGCWNDGIWSGMWASDVESIEYGNLICSRILKVR